MYHLARSLYLYATSKEGTFCVASAGATVLMKSHTNFSYATEYSVLLLGLDNAGKTTLLNQIKALYPSSVDSSTTLPQPSATAGNTVPTVGQNVATITLPDMYLKFWDVGGQMSLRRLWQSYYASAHAVVFVVDSTDLGGRGGYFDFDAARRKGDMYEDGSVASPAPLTTPITPFSPQPQSGRLEECRKVLESVLSHSDAAGLPVLVLANKQDREDCVEVVRIKEGFIRRVFEGEKGGMVRDSRVLPLSALNGTGVKEAVGWVRSRVGWNKEGRPPVMR